MKTYNPNNDNQKWRATNIGHQWINMGTNQPLSVGKGRNWKIDGTIIRDARDNSRTLGRGWDQVEGSVTTVNNGDIIQRFDIVNLPSV